MSHLRTHLRPLTPPAPMMIASFEPDDVIERLEKVVMRIGQLIDT
jgi:hypothetical protein